MVRKGNSITSMGSFFIASFELIGWKTLPPLPPAIDDRSPLLVRLLPKPSELVSKLK